MIFLVLVVACQKQEKTVESPEVDTVYVSSKKIRNTIEMTKVEVVGMNTSYSGHAIVRNEEILFLDKYFGLVHRIDVYGNVKDIFLGQGEGPKELDIKLSDGFTILRNGYPAIFGGSLDVHLYSQDWIRDSKFFMSWTGTRTHQDVYRSDRVDAESSSMYSPDFEKLELKPSYSDPWCVYIPIYSEHPKFNAFVSDTYYLEGKILAKYNLKTNSVENLFGSRPPIYLQKRYIGHHAFLSFDIDESENIYVTHEIDSLIYIYQNDGQLKSVFGKSGINMDTNYTPLRAFDFDEIERLYYQDKPRRGYYERIFVDAKEDLVFRTYRKGEGRMNGLQIYRNKQCAVDADVPENFKVLGKIGSKYLSDLIFDEENQEVYFYTFIL